MNPCNIQGEVCRSCSLTGGLFGQDLRLFVQGFVSVRRVLRGAKGSSAAGSGVWITAMEENFKKKPSGRRAPPCSPVRPSRAQGQNC